MINPDELRAQLDDRHTVENSAVLRVCCDGREVALISRWRGVVIEAGVRWLADGGLEALRSVGVDAREVERLLDEEVCNE